MKLESVGIIIALRPFGERDVVARLFTRDYGMLVGIMKGAQVAKKNKPLVGQMGVATWNARLEDQLGAFHFENDRNLAAPIMSDARALSLLNSAFALLSALLPEREKYESLYQATESLLQNLIGDSARHYLDWEISLLRELGYALDLTHCSNCGRTDDLTHLSQRTGRAVCSECAAPYVSQCFPMPVDLNATKFFLSRIAAEQGVPLPNARNMV